MMTLMTRAILLLLTVVFLNGTLSAGLLITEVMFNPSGRSEINTEWVELYNSGPESVDLSGWIFDDVSTISFTLPEGTRLGAYSAAVLVNHDAPEDFRKAWKVSDDVPVLYGGEFRLLNSSDHLRLWSHESVLIDEVVYGGTGWPSSTDGVSIYLQSHALSASENDVGDAWSLSKGGTDGAFHSIAAGPFLAGGTGSPGYVAHAQSHISIPEPALLGPLSGLIVAAFLWVRRRP